MKPVSGPNQREVLLLDCRLKGCVGVNWGNQRAAMVIQVAQGVTLPQRGQTPLTMARASSLGSSDAADSSAMSGCKREECLLGC